MEHYNILLSALDHIKAQGLPGGKVIAYRVTDRTVTIVLEAGAKHVIDRHDLTVTIRITPSAMALADANKINVTGITPSGKNGVILVTDVREAIDNG